MFEHCINEVITTRIRPYWTANLELSKTFQDAYEQYVKDYISIEQYHLIIEDFIRTEANSEIKEWKDVRFILGNNPYFKNTIQPTMNEEQLEEFYKHFYDLMNYKNRAIYNFYRQEFNRNVSLDVASKRFELKSWGLYKEKREEKCKKVAYQIKQDWILYKRMIEQENRMKSYLLNAVDGQFNRNSQALKQLSTNGFMNTNCSEWLYNKLPYNGDGPRCIIRKRKNQIQPYLDELKQTQASMKKAYEQYQTVIAHKRIINELNDELAKLNNNDYKYTVNIAKLIVEIDAIRKVL